MLGFDTLEQAFWTVLHLLQVNTPPPLQTPPPPPPLRTCQQLASLVSLLHTLLTAVAITSATACASTHLHHKPLLHVHTAVLIHLPPPRAY